MALSHEDDPDSQMPLPFAAANEYAAQVMRWSRQLPMQGLRVWRNVRYGDHALQRCDVFAPANAQPGSPILIFWHGGGWTNGYPAYVHFMAQALCSRGWVLVCPGYRLAPAHLLPTAIEDACAALEFAHAHALQWGADRERIALAGHSAGGHLALMAAAMTQAHSQLGMPRCAVPAHAIVACLPVSGIMDLRCSTPAPGSLEARVYELLLQKQEHDALMSPIFWSQALAKSGIPIDLSWGALDSERVQNSNQALRLSLQEQGARVITNIEPGQNHFQTHTALKENAHSWYERLDQYLKQAYGVKQDARPAAFAVS